MGSRSFTLIVSALAIVIAAACSGGDSGPKPTATPKKPSAEDALTEWVNANRNVAFVTDCDKAERGIDTGKLCARLKGERGTMRAYELGPTFSDPTSLALLNEVAAGWIVLSVTNRDPNDDVPGIPWPLQEGDAVVVVGLDDCLRVREQPTQEGKQIKCIEPGTRAIVQEGPVEAETFKWWRIAGEEFNGWAAGTWLRTEDAVRDALTPPTAEASATPE